MLKKQNKTKNPKCQITHYFSLLNHISFQSVQRAVAWDLWGAPSLQQTFMNITPKQASHTSRRPPESLIHWCAKTSVFLPGGAVSDPELWRDASSGCQFFSILYEGPFGYMHPHLTTATNSFQFRTNSISAHELFLLAYRLRCSKACFWKTSPK